jgi:hypothetical protein
MKLRVCQQAVRGPTKISGKDMKIDETLETSREDEDRRPIFMGARLDFYLF